MQDQSALGGRQINRLPGFNVDRLARVTSIKELYTAGRIEVVFLDFSQPSPVWVVGDIDREPVEGDMVVIGYLDGRKDAPYLRGFVKNSTYTTNFMILKKDKIKLQLPIFEIGVKNGKSHKDVQGNLLDNNKQVERAYIELVEEHALVSFPTSEDGSTPPATIKITKDNITIDHPGGILLGSEGRNIARVGDTITGTTSGGQTVSGTITSGTSKIKS